MFEYKSSLTRKCVFSSVAVTFPGASVGFAVESCSRGYTGSWHLTLEWSEEAEGPVKAFLATKAVAPPADFSVW